MKESSLDMNTNIRYKAYSEAIYQVLTRSLDRASDRALTVCSKLRKHPIVTSMASLAMVCIAALPIAGFSQSQDQPPVQRVLTDTAGRKIEATILSKTETGVKFTRNRDGKEFELPIRNLSAEDQRFLKGLGLGKPIVANPIAAKQPSVEYKIPDKEFTAGEEMETSVPVKQTEFEITLKGTPVKITQVGNGPVGVIFFGHSDSAAMKKYILSDIKAYNSLLQQKTTFFLWEYPTTGPFDEVQAAIKDYQACYPHAMAKPLTGSAKKTRPDFKGVATEVLKNIREKTKLQKFLLVGNSLGAGIILWDYKNISADPNVSFLLISPTEAFMPPNLPKLERTMLLSATGWKNKGKQQRMDSYLQGTNAFDWVLANLDTDAANKISVSVWDECDGRLLFKQNGSYRSRPAEFERGHHIICEDDIQNGLLRKIIKVKLGLKPNTILAERARPFSAKDPYDLTNYPPRHNDGKRPEDPTKMAVEPVPVGVVLIKIPNGASALVEFKKEKDGDETYKWKYRPGPSAPIQTGEGKHNMTPHQAIPTGVKPPVRPNGAVLPVTGDGADWAAGYDNYIQAGGIFIKWQGNCLQFYRSRGSVTKLQAGDFDKEF
jgi:hypothetical protein